MKLMNDYTKGILTGASLILCFFMFVSAKSQGENLGDITVRSLSVSNADGGMAVTLGVDRAGSGNIKLSNPDGKMIAYLGGGAGIDNVEARSGNLAIYNADGTHAATLDDRLITYNKHEGMTGWFGTNKNNDGMAMLMDRYSNIGWNASGKK